MTAVIQWACSFPAGWPQHCIMRGHDGRVLTFIYPHAYNSRSCDNTLLLSGGEDFTVRLWNLYTGSLLHTYRAQSGPVCSLQAVPADLAVSGSGVARLCVGFLPVDGFKK